MSNSEAEADGVEEFKGRTIDGKYEVGKTVRRQRFYTVYHATGVDGGQDYLFKVIKKNLVEPRKSFATLKPNLAVVASLGHAGALKLRDFGEAADTIYLAEEFYDGDLLSSLLDPSGAVDTPYALNLGIKIAEAIGTAHSRGVVHGLISPESILVGDDPEVKVSDFYYLYFLTQELKSTDEFQGRDIVYCAPEVIAGGQPDFASDVYSLGIVLYELLTGRPPFEREGALAVALEKEMMDVRSPRELNPEIPHLLESVVLKCIKKDPEARYDDARKLVAELHLCRSSLARAMAARGKTADSESMARWAKMDRSQKAERLSSSDRPRKLYDETLADDYPDLSDVGSPGPPARAGRFPPGFIPFLVSLFILVSLLVVGYRFVSSLLTEETGIKTVIVPDVVNTHQVEAKALLGGANLEPKVDPPQYSREVPEGFVISQSPPGGTKVKSGRVVELVVSAGEKHIAVPKVSGLPEEDAVLLLEKAGFKVGDIRREFNEQIDEGFVIGQLPEPGEERYAGSKITIFVSKGRTPRLITMPRVVGLPVYEARSILQMNDLDKVVVKNMETGAGIKDYVVAQSILEGTRINIDQQVTLYKAVSPSSVSFVPVRGEIKLKVSTPGQWQEVIIMVYDQEGGREEYRNTHENGDVVRVTVTGYGKTHIKVYLDGILAKEQTL